jgi:hypothetical protein
MMAIERQGDRTLESSSNLYIAVPFSGSMAQAVAIAQMHNPKNPLPISQSKSSRALAIAQRHNPQNLT